MEIADVFVVNKADREGVDRVVAEIESMLSLATHDSDRPEIVKTVATDDRGIDEVLAAVEAFRSRADASGQLARKRRAQLRRQFEDALGERLMRRVRSRALPEADLERIVDRIAARELDPFSASDEVLGRIGL
jgi:LAO/AO transport system kinase